MPEETQKVILEEVTATPVTAIPGSGQKEITQRAATQSNAYAPSRYTLNLDNNYLVIDLEQTDGQSIRNVRGFYPKSQSTFAYNFGTTVDSKTGRETFGPQSVSIRNMMTQGQVVISMEDIDLGKVFEGKNALTIFTLTTFLTTNTAI